MDPADILVTDQVAIVTGAGAGIGQGIADCLARFGADVVIAEIDPDRAETTAKLVRDAGREPLVVPTDVMDTDQVRSMVDTAKDHFGRIDILVNNVGGVRSRLFVEQNERSWRRHIDINFVSVLAATDAVAPIMIEQGNGGSIVNVTSIEGSRAAPTFSVYAACKAAMISFTRTLAVELGGDGIRVNAIGPDITPTPGMMGLRTGPVPSPLPPLDDYTADGAKRYIPLGAPGHVDDCGATVVFLSSKMGSYITGATIPVDGGTLAAAGWTRAADDGQWGLWHPFSKNV
jgi:NAD(P)-dependent dehydrogenase (short-subunit alcohol dehydrogenase family)